MKKQLMALILAMALIWSTGVACAQATVSPWAIVKTAEIEPRYSLITSFLYEFYRSGDSLIMSATVTGDPSVTSAKASFTLMGMSPGTTWKTIGTWSATGTRYASKAAQKAMQPGHRYQLKVSVSVSNGTSSEKDSEITEIIGMN